MIAERKNVLTVDESMSGTYYTTQWTVSEHKKLFLITSYECQYQKQSS